MLIFAPTGAGRSFGTAAQYNGLFRAAPAWCFFCTAEQYTISFSAPPRRGEGDGGFAPGRLGLGTLSPDPADFGHGRNLSLRRVIEREGKTYGFPSHILSLFAFLWAYQ